jgi:tripartite-type tricarboxylate transporter receptor subunit TctC
MTAEARRVACRRVLSSSGSAQAQTEEKMRHWRVGLAIGVAALSAVTVWPAAAKDYPDKPVRIVVPAPPGGVVDVIARVFAPKLSEVLGGRFYVENHPGASAELGTARVAAAAADGSTILFTSPDFITVPALKAKASYDPITSFVPVTLATTAPGLISVNSSLRVASMSELFALLKANPGKYAYATPGHGTVPHLEAEQMFRLARGLDVVHVPFQGFGPAVTSTIAGHTSILTGGATSIIVPQVNDGRLRALVISSRRRFPGLPDVPTKDEAGVPEWGGGFWGGVMAPAGTPSDIVTSLHRAIVQIMQQPEVKERLAVLGYEPVGSPPDEFAAWLKAEYAKWREVVRKANLKVE